MKRIKIVYPFKREYPISLAFGVMPKDENIRGKYHELQLLGHNGLDFALPEGTEVIAVYKGDVSSPIPNKDFGISIVVIHSWGISLYAHLKKSIVKTGQTVKKGEVIGLSGKTGFTKGAHLHFGIKPQNPDDINGYLGFIDPSKYFMKERTK